MLDLLQKVTQQLIPSGIPQHLKKFYEWMTINRHREISSKIPSVLTLIDLKIGFLLWMYSCAVTFIVFIFELIGRAVLLKLINYFSLIQFCERFFPKN